MYKPILTDDNDIVIEREYGPLHMLGAGGKDRELVMVENLNVEKKLPVLLGAGLGHALKVILQKHEGPLAIVDKELEILKISKTIDKLPAKQKKRILLISTQDVDEALQTLTTWQSEHGLLPFLPIIHPFYMRLDRPWYGKLRKHLEASNEYDFWTKARKPRFSNNKPRLLLITSKYFLMGEVAFACKRLNIDYEILKVPNDSMASSEFIENLLMAVIKFKPDCLLTLNHLGVDIEGVLIDLLEKLQIPLASWFVDNPHLILHLYNKLKSPWVSIFTWDFDNISSLKAMGFENVFYLPLGTDTTHFKPNTLGKKKWKCPISFVGNSMHYKVISRLNKTPLPQNLLKHFNEVSKHFDASPQHSVAEFIQDKFPDTYKEFASLDNNEQRLCFETAVTWEATRLYRARCVEQTLPFNPLIVGDDGWEIIFEKQKKQFTLHDALNYYEELHTFYPLSDINFNCTSKQMKGAVNQRIFDVPACNAFVLTDWREQMDNLFEPHKEIAFYKEIEEIPELIKFYLDNPKAREQITKAARKRVLAEHTWDNRLQTLLSNMKQVYGIEDK